MVPTSTEGMDTEIWRHSSSVLLERVGDVVRAVFQCCGLRRAYFSIIAMQLLLSMFWAASWPVARNIAVTMLAAWA